MRRRRRKKQKRLNTFTALIAAIVFTTTTVWASTGTTVPALFSPGEPSPQSHHANGSYGSVTDGAFTLALEDVLVFQDRAAILYSVEALTKTAKVKLMEDSFDGSVSITPRVGLYQQLKQEGEMKDLRTDTKKYFFCSVEGLDNLDGLPLSLGLDIMENEEKYIELPADFTTERLEVTLDGPLGKGTVIVMNAMELFMEKEVAQGFDYPTTYTDVFFRMEDGSVKTFNQLFLYKSSSYMASESNDDGPARYKSYSVARGTLDLSTFKSIIVDGWEYDLKDTTKAQEVHLGEGLRPFTQEVYTHKDAFMVPVQEVVEKLGGEITFNRTGEHAVIRYRDSTIEIQVGEKHYFKDGARFSFNREPNIKVINGGILVMHTSIMEQCLGVTVEPNLAKPEMEIWYIIP